MGTRGSPLALVQAREIAAQLKSKAPELQIKIKKIKTSGDRFKGKDFAAAGGKGLFVKEIEEALLKGEIDFALHSLKDLPGVLPVGLILAPFPKREIAYDAFLSIKYKRFEDLPSGACVGTSSPRRLAQIKWVRKDLIVEGVRGNIDTRLKKLSGGEYDALILATAGLKRLGKAKVIRHTLDTSLFIPAVGQGGLAVEVREGNESVFNFLSRVLGDKKSDIELKAERAFLKEIGGDCHTPLAAHAFLVQKVLRMVGWIGAPDGKTAVRLEQYGDPKNPVVLGKHLARLLLFQGGKGVLEHVAK